MFPQDVFLPKEVLVAREESRIRTGKNVWYMPVLALGGKAEYTRQGGSEVITLKWDDEKSFRDGAIAATASALAIADAAKTKASEETARIAAQESTKRAANSNSTELLKLKETNRHTEALMELEEAAAVVPTPVPTP